MRIRWYTQYERIRRGSFEDRTLLYLPKSMTGFALSYTENPTRSNQALIILPQFNLFHETFIASIAH